MFQQVYDWVGSLAPSPEHFEIRDFRGYTVSPHKDISSGSFNIAEIECQPVIESSGESVHDSYTDLSGLREEEKKKLSKEVTVDVSREDIYQDMIKLYRKWNTNTSVLKIFFKAEDAVGDGVSRDAFSEFYDRVYQKMEGQFEKIPASRYEDTELNILGEIIHHAFVLYEVFPVQLCKSTLKHYLHQDVSGEELSESFLSFITPTERDLIKNLQEKSSGNKQAIQDILQEYSVFEIPNSENIMSLVEKAANVALIKQPCYNMQKIVEGMGNFWEIVTPEMIDSLYHCTIPSAEDVISMFNVAEKQSQDQKITTWLHRYVRCCDKHKLARFIRFITSSETLLPRTVIKVEYVNHSPPHLHPYATTCFKILSLLRQFSSFYELKENLDLFINQGANWGVYDNSI